MAVSAEALARGLKKLLPRGALWLFRADSVLSRMMLGIADELARVVARGVDLIDESDPRTATETLDEWETTVGLPDHCVEEIPGTDEERRLAITQKLIKRGGQTPALYIALAAACGYTVTIAENYGASIARCGVTECGSPMYGTQWAHVWSIEVEAPSGPALSHDELECIIDRAKPAHTFVFFVYL